MFGVIGIGFVMVDYDLFVYMFVIFSMWSGLFGLIIVVYIYCCILMLNSGMVGVVVILVIFFGFFVGVLVGSYVVVVDLLEFVIYI